METYTALLPFKCETPSSRMMNLKDDTSHSQREHQEAIRVSREHTELLATLICLKALHSPSTETLSKGQEWKGMVQDLMVHSVIWLFFLQSVQKWDEKPYLLLLQISVWKSRKTDTFLSRLSEGLAITIVINYSMKKVHFVAQHFWEQSCRNIF